MKKIVFAIVFLVSTITLLGQGDKDTLKTNKTNFRFGVSLSLLTSKLINSTLTQFGETVYLHPIQYHSVTPQLAVIGVIEKNKFFIKNELAYYKILTRFSYNQDIKLYNPNREENWFIAHENHYRLLKYSLGIGIKFDNFSLGIGTKLNYFVSGDKHYQINSRTEDVYSFTSENRVFYGLNFELNYYLFKYWFLGVSSSISNKISADSGVLGETYVSTIQFTVGLFLNKK